jgi:DNA-binding transcriptional LysR family regulator
MNITKASQELFISQPALTSSIKMLEKSLKVNLIHRIKGRISITHEGEIFLTQSLELINNYDKLKETMADLADKRKQVKIGIPLQVSVVMIPIIFGEFHKKFKDIKIEVMESGGIHIINEVLQGNIQIAVTGIDTDFNDFLDIKHLFKSRACFCVSKNHRYAKYDKIDFSEAINEELVSFNKGFYINKLMYKYCEEMDVVPNILFETNQIYTIKRMVSSNTACAFMLEDALESNDNIVGIPLVQDFDINIGIITKKGTQLYKDPQKALDFIYGKFLDSNRP